jgi:hypothetical protein
VETEQPDENTEAWQRYRATRAMASHCRDVDELTELLEMVGLSAAEGRASALHRAAQRRGA